MTLNIQIQNSSFLFEEFETNDDVVPDKEHGTTTAMALNDRTFLNIAWTVGE